jgi:hypothetical protein
MTTQAAELRCLNDRPDLHGTNRTVIEKATLRWLFQ